MIDVWLSIRWTVSPLSKRRKKRSIKHSIEYYFYFPTEWYLIERCIFIYVNEGAYFSAVTSREIVHQIAQILPMFSWSFYRIISWKVEETYLFLQSRPPVHSTWFFLIVFSFISFILIIKSQINVQMYSWFLFFTMWQQLFLSEC